MSRALIALALLFVAGCEANLHEANFHCKLAKTKGIVPVPQAVCYNSDCEKKIQDHIQYEFKAAFDYLAMGTYFAQEDVNRPGIAKFLLGAASEERSHAILMLDYLNKRGIQTQTIRHYEYNIDPAMLDAMNKFKKIEYKAALLKALDMELDVTQKIYHVIKACGEDYHGADVFTNPILDEQHDGVRHIQGAIKVFDNIAEGMEPQQLKNFAEYTFDMKLLKGEIM